MPPRAHDPVSVSNNGPRMDHQQQQQQQQQQQAPPPLYGGTQGYAYYAAPQYNFNYGGAPVMNGAPPTAWAYGAPMHGMDCGPYAAPIAEEPIIMEPTDNDVLMGRGGKNNQHAGRYHF
jgi:hypothetical protein